MATYKVQHLGSDEIFTRPEIYINPRAEASSPDRQWKVSKADSDIESFHRSLPDYAETKLHMLPTIASELGLSHVFLKDESTRFGLPAFKILGASWAIHRVICERLGLPVTSKLEEVKNRIASHLSQGNDLRIVTSTEGNWGRACARMGKYLQLPITIYVPGFMPEYTRRLIRDEGAEVIVLDGKSYDDTITACREDMRRTGSMLVMDVSWEGYETIPQVSFPRDISIGSADKSLQWVTDGYRTMLFETDRQVGALTGDRRPNALFVAVGVGSWAHAAITHYRALDPQSKIVAVEPTTATSLKESLHCDRCTPVKTGETIMAGMNCGTVSKIAWPVMRDGVNAAVAIEDRESHESVEYLQGQGINAGPCGAATLVALRKYLRDIDEETRRKMIVVLFSTEGWREYEIPH